MDKEFKKFIMKDIKNLYLNEDLAKYNWFNSGGSAEIFFRPNKINELSEFLKRNKKKVNVLGAGSNILIRDGGLKGVTIKLSSKFSFLNLIDKETIQVGASTLDKKLSDFATENSISGFEFLSCIPGSIGGAVKMNCGCFGHDISQIIKSVEAIDFNGNIKEIPSEKINFSYRSCNLNKDLIITSVKFKGHLSNKDNIKKKQLEMIEKKKRSQPNKIKTCGSTFKNTKNKKAWELIKDSNCDNMSLGGAKVSEKHCNFLINDGSATSSEIEELIYKVKKKVLESTGVNLDLEIIVMGEANKK